MPSPILSPRGTVVSIWGKAYVRGVDGQWRLLKLGEVVHPADRLRTEQDSIVMMVDTAGQVRPLQAESTTDTDRVIAALNSADAQAATGAGVAGGEAGGFLPGLRVERIAEAVAPVALGTAVDAAGVEFGRATRSNAPELNNPAAVTADSSNIAALEEGGAIALGLTRPQGGGTLQVAVTQVPAIGQIVTASGTTVTAGSNLSPDDLAGLRYVPPADYDGVTPIAPFAYSVSNGTSTATGSTQISVTAVNDAPVASAGTGNANEDNAVTVSLGGSDVDGSIATLRVTALPANGVLYLANGTTPVASGQALSPAEAATLLFRPGLNFNGNASLSFTVTDNGGSVSVPAVFALTINPVNDAPQAVADSVSTVSVAPVTVAVLANDSDVDGDLLALSGASVSAALGNVVLNPNGSLTFTAAPGVSGPVAVSYTVSDGRGGSASGTLTVSVAIAPSVSVDAPALSNDNTPRITGNSNLPPGAGIRLTVTGANGAVQSFAATVQADGSYSADVPTALADGPYSVVASVSVPGAGSASASDGGSIDTAAPTLSVDAPALDNDSTPLISGTTDLPAGSTIRLTVTDALGAVQTFNATVLAGGTFSANVPAALAQGAFSVVATASDAAGNPASASDSGAIDSVPPRASLTINLIAGDNTVDPSEAASSVTVTGSVGGDVRPNDVVTLIVNGNTYTGSVLTGNVFAIAVSGADLVTDADRRIDASVTTIDAAGNLTTASASHDYLINRTPVANADSLAAIEDTAVIYTAAQLLGNDTDVDGNTLSIASVTSGAGGTAVLNANGTVTFTPSANFNGAADFTYSVTDGSLTSNIATVSVAVAAVNDAPVANADSLTATEDTPVIFTAVQLLGNDTDVDGNTLSIASVTSGAGGTAVLNANGTVTFTPSANFNGAANFTYTVSDGSLTSNTATVTVAVAAVNDAPVANADGLAAIEDTAVIYTAAQLLGNDTDVDGNTLSIARVTSGAGGTAVLNANGTVTFTPSANFNGAADFTYTVTDGSLTSNIATVSVAVAAVNDAPVANADSLAATEDTPVIFTAVQLLGNDTDVDGNTLSIASVTSGAGGTAVLNANGTVTFTPNADFNGAANFTYSVTDGSLTSNIATVSVVVAAVNDAPVANADSLAAIEDTAVIYTAAQLLGNDTDADGNTLSIASVTSGAGGTAVLNANGTVTFTPSANFNGTADFTYTVTDGSLTSNAATVAVAVAAVNDAPVAVNDGGVATPFLTVLEDSGPSAPIAGLANDTDIDGNALVVTAATSPNGSVTINANGTLSFTPVANFNGPTTITYNVSDGNGGTDTATVFVSVTSVNDAPVATSASASTGENSVLNASVPAASDVDGTVASYALASGLGAGNGALTFNTNGSYRFDPGSDFDTLAAGATRQVSFTYTAIDNLGLASTPATVTITVTGTNDRPVLDLDANNSSGATGSDYRAAFTENGPAVSIGDTDVALTDVDSATLVGATITLTNAQTGDVLAAGALPAGITAVVAGNVVTLTGSASLASYQTAIRAVTFNNPGDFPSGVERVLTVVVNDGVDLSTAATSRINLQLVNDAVTPTLSITPLGQWTFNEGSGSTTVNRWANPDQTGTLADDNSSGGTALPTFLTTNQRNATSGSYVSLNDVGDRINVAAAATQPLMGTSSLTFWIRTTQTGGNAGNGGSWDLPGVLASEQGGGGNDIQWGTINNAGRIGFAVGNAAGVYSTTSINNNQWNHVAITRNASTNFVEIWVNGVREATGSPTDAAFNGQINRLTSMGVNNQFSGNAAGSDVADTRYFQGQLDDLRIYDRVLTADQIAAVRAVESGFHDIAMANDGGALRFTLAQTAATTLTVSGLAAGMTVSDGVNSTTVTGPDDVVSLTGWNASALEITNAGANSATLVFTATNVVGSDTQSTVQYLNIVTGTSLLNGGAGADTLNGTAAADLLSGGGSIDILNGGGGNDRLLGGLGDDILNGNAGNDVLEGADGADRLVGGAGSDRMVGGLGADVYEWRLADAGTAGAPPVDRIADFNVAAAGAGGDVLDLRDLLQGETASATLDRFLDFDTTSVPGSTVIHVSSSGAFPIGVQWSAAQAGSENQRIVLEGVDLRASLGLSAAVSDSQIIAELLNRGKLVTDVPPGG